MKIRRISLTLNLDLNEKMGKEINIPDVNLKEKGEQYESHRETKSQN
jgi:hypothetical protein